MPKTRRAQMLLRVAMQADYLRNNDRPSDHALPPPPRQVATDRAPAKREITDLH